MREACILKNLDHPNILKYKDIYINNGIIYLVIEYCDFGDLRKQIHVSNTIGKHFSEELILFWSLQLLDGLKYIHNFNILHRDLKTENIFLDDKGLIKIGDFGVSRQIKPEENEISTLTGTAQYMSPEMVIIGQYYNEKTDVWSMGNQIKFININ